jgi:uncharacterized protein
MTLTIAEIQQRMHPMRLMVISDTPLQMSTRLAPDFVAALKDNARGAMPMKAHAMTAILGLVLLSGSAPAVAQSGPAFDCSKAEHVIEQLICKDEQLAAKDRKIADVYRQSIRAMEKVDVGGAEAIKELKAAQRGWMGGRNDCWKAANKRQCTIDSYDRRTAYLQARYFLVEGDESVYYTCNANTADVIVATFIPTEPPSVRLEHGDRQEIAILSPSASGSRYDGDFGLYFWIKGDEVQVAWPQDNKFSCAVRK